MRSLARLALPLLLLGTVAQARVMWTPMPAEAYQLRNRYEEAQRLLFAFDYGHALVYEKILHLKGTPYNAKQVERELLDEILAILKNPPRVKVDEEEIGPDYVFTLPLLVNLFDWSHLLHQFVYDIFAISPHRGPAMHARVREIFDQYRANEALRITDTCKTMLFMDGQPYSKAFRRRFPSFNLLIWSYHWFQIRLYEALLQPTLAARDREVDATVKRFRELVSDLPESADFDMMPMTAEEAPLLAKSHPTIPSAFDNVHMLHDVVSDMLTSERVPLAALRAEGVRIGRVSQDPDAYRCPAKPAAIDAARPQDAGASRAKAAELALHRTERLVSLGKIPDAFLWKVKRLQLSPIPHEKETDPAFAIVLEQYPGAGGGASRLELTLDGNGKALKSAAPPGPEAAGAPAWPDKDPVTLCENSLHYVLDNVVVKKELEPYFHGFESLELSPAQDAQGKPVARIDIRSSLAKPVLRVTLKVDGTFASAEFVAR